MTEVSFDIFDAKFDKGLRQEQFERLCLHVFCRYCKIEDGVFQYDNHSGIETIDVQYSGKWTGFQAKYFTKDLPGHKNDFLDSITKTRKHNTRVEKVLFFLPVNPSGVSAAADEGQKPAWMLEIEVFAAQKGIEVEWFGLSRLRSVFAEKEMQYLARHYFCQNPDLWDCVSLFKRITESRMLITRNSIPFEGENIHLEHRKEIEQLENSDSRTITIISGAGGVGKSALVKDWFGSCATCANCALMMQPNDVVECFGEVEMSKAWRATTEDFLKMTAGEYGRRVLVVDSVEKLADGKDLSELLLVLRGLFVGGWRIVLTTRTMFEKQIVSHFKTFMPEAKLDVMVVSPVGEDVLTALSRKYGFDLPANVQVRDAIRTSFNLAAYLSCGNLKEAGSLKAFQDAVWTHFVMGDDPADTAGQVFCEYVEEKLRKEIRVLSVPAPTEDTRLLMRRGIIVPREGATGYFVAHDVYEEWAAIRMMSGKLQEFGLTEFEKYVISSHGLRRGFQLLVGQRLAEIEEGEDSLLWSFLNSARDSIRVDFVLALLRSESIGKFLKLHSGKLLEKDSFAFESIVAGAYNFGRRPEGDLMLLSRQRPEEHSWREIIDFACANQEALQDVEAPTLLLLMQDWSLTHPENDSTTEACARFAWKAIALGKYGRAHLYHWKKQLADLVLSSSGCAKKKFEDEVRQHLSVPVNERNCILEEVCRRLLCDTMTASSIVSIRYFPKLVRDLASAYWRPERDPHKRYHELERIECEYGLPEYGFEYFPPSSFQGPTYMLLKTDLVATLLFIIDLVNACVADASRANPKRFDTVILTMPNGEKIEQKISLGLWDCYRDKGYGEHVPYLLKAVHMALERFLLEMSESRKNDETCETILWMLLLKSKSASLTAVVASIVMAHPMEFVRLGLVLIAERKFFAYDARRHFAELQPDCVRALFPFPKREHDYIRDLADKHSVRGVSLENVIWQYQIISSKVVPDLKQRVERLLDDYARGWDAMTPADKFWLTRIDVRRQNLKVSVDEKTNQSLISGELILGEDLQKRKEESEAFTADQRRMMKLAQWGTERIQGKTPPKDSAYSDLKNVLKDFQWLMTRPVSASNSLDIVEPTARRATAAALIVFYRDELDRPLQRVCERVLLASLDLIFDDRYRRVKWDRVDVAIFAIPYLLPHLGWWNRVLVRNRFAMALLDETGDNFWGMDRICDFGMAGVRAYFDHVGDKRFVAWIQRAYRRHFLHYQAYMRYLMTPSAGSLFWKMRITLYRVLQKIHVKVPGFLVVDEWMAPRPKLAFQNTRRAYASSFMARHRLTFKVTEDDLAHWACNAIGFHFPPKLSRREEMLIISNVKCVLEYLFRANRKRNSVGSHLYTSQMGRSYMKQLGYCLLNMSAEGRKMFLVELAKVPQVLRKPQFLDCCLKAQYDQQRADGFWEIWNGLLPMIAAEFEKVPCRSYDSQQVLDVMALRPLYWEGDGQAWRGDKGQLPAYFDSLVTRCGKHRHLVVSIMNFVCGAGQQFLTMSLGWIDRALMLSKDEYDYQNENVKEIKECFERVAPLITERIEEIKSDDGVRSHCISILDNLISQNSLTAFRLREIIMR